MVTFQYELLFLPYLFSEVLEAYTQFKEEASEDGFKTFILKFDKCYEKVHFMMIFVVNYLHNKCIQTIAYGLGNLRVYYAC